MMDKMMPKGSMERPQPPDETEEFFIPASFNGADTVKEGDTILFKVNSRIEDGTIGVIFQGKEGGDMKEKSLMEDFAESMSGDEESE